MKSAITGIHPSGDLTREITIAQQKLQPAYSIPVAMVADILLEGTSAVTAQVAMETRTTPGQTPNKASILTQPPTQR
ncbi:MAG: hypothetical protein WBO24_08070 [Nitrospirales bacterium]